jgi:hypothetical protein
MAFRASRAFLEKRFRQISVKINDAETPIFSGQDSNTTVGYQLPEEPRANSEVSSGIGGT